MKRLGYVFLAVLISAALSGGAFAQLPPPPVNLTVHAIPPAAAIMLQGVVLNWELPKFLPPVPSMSSTFRVYRSVDDSVSFKFLNATDKMEYNDPQVAAGHTYYYYVTWVWVMPDSTVRESSRSNLAWITPGPSGGEKTGKIVGTVTDSLTGKPLAYSRVMFFRPSSPILWIPQVWSDTAGKYSAVLDTGKYLVECNPPLMMVPLMSMIPWPAYQTKWYKNAHDAAHATPVAVTDGGVDTVAFALVKFVPPVPVHIRGTVLDSTGNPLKAARVVIMRTGQEIPVMAASGALVTMLPGEKFADPDLGCVFGVAWEGLTDSAGAYDATVLSERSYTALAVKGGYFPQYYDHKSTPSEATVIPAAGDVSGIDFNLNPHRPPQIYSISGIVWDSAGVRVPSRVIVFPLRPYASRAVRFGFSDSLGAFSVGHLLAGKYILLAVPFGDYAPAFYKAGAFGVLKWKDEDTVTVSGDVSGIDIGVKQIHSNGVATLSGTITAGGQGLEGVNVVVEDAGGAALGYGMTDGTGSYVIDALPAGALTITADLMGYNDGVQSTSIGASQFAMTQDFSLGVATSVSPSGSAGVPASYALGQNYPNPFNPSTRIDFSLPVAGTATMKIFNLLGQEVVTLVNGPLASGTHETVWDGRDAAGRVLSSGVYFYRLEVKGPDGGAAYSAMKKMVLLK